MNFLEAVQALKDGRCEAIKRSCWGTRTLIFTSMLWDSMDNCPAFDRMPVDNFLADDWQLVNEKPQVEEVESVLWQILGQDGSKHGCYPDFMPTLSAEEKLKGWQVIEYRSHYTREVPRKVKRREELGIAIRVLPDKSVYSFPIDAKIYAEWQEEVKP